ncbi:MAG: hypothetical protein GXO77_06400 [Calditrichaeota bacterium]|nr:hypothetical protein [Calditrichota bacterium]
MQQFKIKVPRAIKRIDPQIISAGKVTKKSGRSKSEQKEKDLASSLIEAQKIKLYKDRIKVLELELQRAREESFKAGYEEGKENTLREANKRIEIARKEIARMEKEYRESLERIENPLLELAKEIAREILNTELSLREDYDAILLERLRRMLQEVLTEKKVTVEVHPAHLPFLTSSDIKEALNLPREMELTVLQGKRLKKGEAFVTTEQFYIDGRFKSQIEELGNQLLHGDET